MSVFPVEVSDNFTLPKTIAHFSQHATMAGNSSALVISEEWKGRSPVYWQSGRSSRSTAAKVSPVKTKTN